jgi:hypothetical protein
MNWLTTFVIMKHILSHQPSTYRYKLTNNAIKKIKIVTKNDLVIVLNIKTTLSKKPLSMRRNGLFSDGTGIITAFGCQNCDSVGE